IEPPGDAQPADGVDVDPARFVGVYENLVQQIRVEEEDSGLVARVASVLYGQPGPSIGGMLRPIDETSFLMPMPATNNPLPLVFFDPGEARRAQYVHAGGRASRRVD